MFADVFVRFGVLLFDAPRQRRHFRSRAVSVTSGFNRAITRTV